ARPTPVTGAPTTTIATTSSVSRSGPGRISCTSCRSRGTRPTATASSCRTRATDDEREPTDPPTLLPHHRRRHSRRRPGGIRPPGEGVRSRRAAPGRSAAGHLAHGLGAAGGRRRVPLVGLPALPRLGGAAGGGRPLAGGGDRPLRLR